jgi:Glycosyl transferase family 2
MTGSLPGITYVLPIKVAEPAGEELTGYLRRVATWCPVVVVDGSAADVFAVHHEAWGGFLTHRRVTSRTVNGKVAGTVDGVAAATTPLVVLADDDVRYDEAALTRLAGLLEDHDAVVPQNYFDPLPWHARWDSGRTLLNRALGHDYAGTAGIRRDALLGTRGYCGAVLFENLEMLRTLAAQGGRVRHAKDVFVARRPPTFRHFLGQRVRQAFDSDAQRPRQVLELAGLPLLAAATLAGPRWLLGAAAVTVGVAEAGRRAAGGRQVFAADLALWAPFWVLERSVCAWLAVAAKARGGVRYAGRRLGTSAHPVDRLAGAACPEGTCRCDTVLRPVTAGGPRTAPATAARAG